MPQIQLKNVRLSYANVWSPEPPFDNPDGPKKYSSALLFPKNDKANKEALLNAINEAKEKGKGAKWGGVIPKNLDIGIRDGNDKLMPDGETVLEGYEDMKYINAKANEGYQPPIVNRRAVPITDQSEVYSGCYCNVFVDVFPYSSAGKKGVSFGLVGIQKIADGEPLGATFSINKFDVFDDGDAVSSVDDDDNDDWD